VMCTGPQPTLDGFGGLRAGLQRVEARLSIHKEWLIVKTL